MIVIEDVRRSCLAGDGLYSFSVDGLPAAYANGGDVAAGLVVAPVTETVKLVADGTVTASLDRENLMSITGFVLASDVLDALDGDRYDAAGLIEAVRRMGFGWRLISPSSSV